MLGGNPFFFIIMEYKQENGTVLKGFSQVDLDKLYREVREVKIVFGCICLIFLLYIFYMTWYVIHNNVLNNIVANCL